MVRLSRQNEPTPRDHHVAPRIALVSSAYPVRSETFVFNEVRGLRERGWNVTTVSLHEPPEPAAAVLGHTEPLSIVVYGSSLKRTLVSAASEVFRHPLRSSRTVACACRDALRTESTKSVRVRLRIVPQAVAAIGLAGQLRQQGVRMIHCHFAHAPTTLGMYAAMQLGVPFSFVGHANDLYQRRVLLQAKLQRAAFVSCISTVHRELYLSIAPRDESVYPIIRCGVNTEQFHDVKRTESDLSRGASLLAVCRLVEKKGIDTLIYALAQLRHAGGENDDAWYLTIAGSGPDEARLRALAGKLDCSDVVHWTGSVNSLQVRQLMRSADLFVLPCREDSSGDRDGIPVVLMEAMASGLPVITGDVASIGDLVRDGETGLVVPGGNAAAAVSAILRLCHDDEERRRLASAGRAHVVAEFSSSENHNRLERALYAALGWREPAPPTDTPSIVRQSSTSISARKEESHV